MTSFSRAFANSGRLAFVLLSQLLDLIFGRIALVLAHLLVFLGLIRRLVCVATNVAYRDLRFFRQLFDPRHHLSPDVG